MPRYGLKVDQFLGHFVSQAKDIGTVVSPFHRKMLYASAFDPLARAAYGTIGTHRDRFVRLIRDVAKWPESERVSLPQLQLRLLEAKRHRYLLYRNISKRLASWEDGGKVLLSGSPSMAEILVQAAPSEHALAKEAPRGAGSSLSLLYLPLNIMILPRTIGRKSSPGAVFQ